MAKSMKGCTDDCAEELWFDDEVGNGGCNAFSIAFRGMQEESRITDMPTINDFFCTGGM